MSYLREEMRYTESSLPSISQRTGLVTDGLLGNRLGSLEDISAFTDGERHVRFNDTTRTSITRERETDGHGSPVFYPRPPSPTHAHNRRHILELQDQLKLYKDELASKDKLISQLSSLETPRTSKRIDTTKFEEAFSSDRLAAAAMAKSEAAALQVRVEGLQSELREAKAQVEIREEKIKDLKLEVETERENNVKHMTLANSLKQQLVRYDAEAGSLEGAATRSELAVQTLQAQNTELQNRILELETRIRSHLEDREILEQKVSEVDKKYQKIRLSLASSLNIDLSVTSDVSFDLAAAKVKELTQENASLRAKVSSWKDYTSNAELENKASRETIQRLASEVDREQQRGSRAVLELDNARVERDQALDRVRDLESELISTRERLESNQRAWTTTRKELEEREGRVNILDREAKDSIMMARTSEQQLKSFKEQLVGLLSDSKVTVEPIEEAIRDRIKLLIQSSKERYAVSEILERKVNELSEQLEQHKEVARSAERRTQRLEVEFRDVEQRMVRKDEEYAQLDIMRDGLRADKERYFRFLEELSRMMNMDPITADVGLDMATEAVLGRARQLASLEADALQDRKTTIYNLQRKLKAFKEQLESKDLHLDLLRKKVTSLETRLTGKTEVEKERDSETMKNRKIAKLAEKYKKELQEAQFEIRDLKSRLLETSDMKSRTLEQERHLDMLESKVGQLERVRQKQADHIAGLRDNLHSTVQDMDSKRSSCNSTIQNMTSELRTTKTALAETQAREQQLLDLRQVLARMLGLDVNTLAVPDYEIISRLEKLILANQSNAVATTVIDGALSGMNESFKAGYEDASRSLQARSRSPVRTSTMQTRTTRTRSMSPTKRDLTRAY